jgi:hypothetical protein
MYWWELYHRLGWNMIPLDGKQPVIPWKEYQGMRNVMSELVDWFHQSRYNVGLVCGRISSGLYVVDVDRAEDLPQVLKRFPGLERAPRVRTGRGWHLYLRWPNPPPCLKGEGYEIRGEGGYVVAPPSRHPGGGRYRWFSPPGALDFDPAPLLPEREEGNTGQPPNPWVSQALQGPVPEGARNVTAARLAGFFLSRLPQDVTWEILRAWNLRACRPPMDEEELLRTIRSISRYHGGGEAG